MRQMVIEKILTGAFLAFKGLDYNAERAKLAYLLSVKGITWDTRQHEQSRQSTSIWQCAAQIATTNGHAMVLAGCVLGNGCDCQ